MADSVICISDAEDEHTSTTPIMLEDSKDDVRDSPLVLDEEDDRVTDLSFSTPERPRKRRAIEKQKPFTPSSTTQSTMNASLVFDMVTSLSTNDPGVAIATLRSIVVLGKEYPSNLLYDELIDRILSVEAVAYADAVSIYSALVFVFDKAATCSCEPAFPHQWEPLATTLQDVASGTPTTEAWRRNLLVVQFYTYCFKKNFATCRERYESIDKDAWVQRTRLFELLAGDSAVGPRKVKAKVHNNLILQALGCALQLWTHVYDQQDDTFRHEGEDTCIAVVRLIEMLYLCTDQIENMLQRIQAGVLEMSRPTRIKFSQALQSADLKVRVATTVMGLTNKSRSRELEWSECNAVGRVVQALNRAATDDVKVTDGYSWSHLDSLMSAPPRNDFTRLIQEIVNVQQNQ